MTYVKPELCGYPALATIHSGPNRKMNTQTEPGQQEQTPAAYEADE